VKSGALAKEEGSFAAKDAEERKSFTAEVAKHAKENNSFTAKAAIPSSLPLLPTGRREQ
jgi:hypothetical protein